MVEFMDTLFYRLRFFIVGMIMLGSLLLLPFLLSTFWVNPKAQAAAVNPDANSAELSIEDNPNLITQGMFKAADKVGKITNSTGEAINTGLGSATKTIASATAQSGKFVADSVSSGTTLVVGGVSNGINLTAHGVGNSFEFAVDTTGNIFGAVANAPIVSTIIKPSDKAPVPVIDTSKTVLAATQATPPATTTAPQPKVDSNASWPMHGEITTQFGVPHWPYQPTHTGIDISDGQRSGVTPIKLFKPGRVIETTVSNVGLGKHVIVDHGGGITSVYGHLASISVQVGQEVNQSTTLGYEGSTGASTGTHLHFEIRLNGQPVDPRQYVGGQP